MHLHNHTVYISSFHQKYNSFPSIKIRQIFKIRYLRRNRHYHNFCCLSFIIFLVYVVIYEKERFVENNFVKERLANHFRFNPRVNYSSFNGLESDKPFIILFWTNWYGAPVEDKGFGGEFIKPLCQKDFLVTSNKSLYDVADVVVFQFADLMRDNQKGKASLPETRREDQPWILASQEASVHYRLFKINNSLSLDGMFNWTWSFRGDSTIHSRFEDAFEKREQEDVKWTFGSEFAQEFLKNKTKLGAWVVTNCRLQPSQRNDLVDNLKKSNVTVDVYGGCGNKTCKRDIGNRCFESLGTSYKFYFALENALCHDYITEKVAHGLLHGMVPVVYALGDVSRVAPVGSYINVFDFPTVEDLAKYLLYLDENPNEYFKYFEWRREWNVERSTFKYQCEIYEKMRAALRDLKSEKGRSKYKNVYYSLGEWYDKFYNPRFNKMCDVCLRKELISAKEPQKNSILMYQTERRCQQKI